jgi:hypothetical protein
MFLETSVGVERTTRRYIPEDGTVHDNRCETYKSYITSTKSRCGRQRVPQIFEVGRVREWGGGGHTKSKAWYVNFECESCPGPEQCSQAWVFKNEFVNWR